MIYLIIIGIILLGINILFTVRVLTVLALMCNEFQDIHKLLCAMSDYLKEKLK